ncbi:MAG TPA: septum formation family protein [Jatrophihabitans sp.]|jgi:hypothetical protein|nr:septum formation family protein [Jatrophihabitans sp.]
MTRVIAAIIAIACADVITACSWFGGGSSSTGAESVFAVRPGQCFAAPTKVHAELSSLQRTPCAAPHGQEAYAVVPYLDAKHAGGSAYPGADALGAFADSACAQKFGGYVGVDYLDSRLFFTYLVPSPRSWEQGTDRNVICFITSTSGPSSQSAKGSKE